MPWKDSMSNSRRLRPQTTVPSVLDAMTGHRMPGGCKDCSAYQTLDRHDTGVYILTVHHDDTCPAYRQLTTP